MLTFATTWVPSWAAVPAPADLDDRHREHPRRGGGVEPPLSGPRPAPRPGGAQPADPAAAHPCPDRWHRRGADHLAARGLRRGAQLGLPLHLAAGRVADRRGAADRRVHRRGQPLAQLAAPRGRRRPRGPPDHVRRRRRATPARARAGPPGRLRRLRPGPDRQRGRRPAPDRRPRRGDDRLRRGPPGRDDARPATAGRCSARSSTTWPTTGTDPTTGCGRSGARSGTSPTPG